MRRTWGWGQVFGALSMLSCASEQVSGFETPATGVMSAKRATEFTHSVGINTHFGQDLYYHRQRRRSRPTEPLELGADSAFFKILSDRLQELEIKHIRDAIPFWGAAHPAPGVNSLERVSAKYERLSRLGIRLQAVSTASYMDHPNYSSGEGFDYVERLRILTTPGEHPVTIQGKTQKVSGGFLESIEDPNEQETCFKTWFADPKYLLRTCRSQSHQDPERDLKPTIWGTNQLGEDYYYTVHLGADLQYLINPSYWLAPSFKFNTWEFLRRSWIDYSRAHRQKIHAHNAASPAEGRLHFVGPSSILATVFQKSQHGYPADDGAELTERLVQSYVLPQPAGLQNYAEYVDFGNIHTYYSFPERGEGGAPPSAARDYYVSPEIRLSSHPQAIYQALFGSRPMMVTETGWRTYPASHIGVNERLQAKLYLRTLLTNFRLGVRRTYIYELLDPLDGGEGWGLIAPASSRQDDHELRLKESFFAVSRLMRALKDAGGAASTFTVRGAAAEVAVQRDGQWVPASELPESRVRHLLFQKSTGEHLLVFWNEPEIISRSQTGDLTQAVRITLPSRLVGRARVFRPLISEAPIQGVPSSLWVTTAPDDPVIIEFTVSPLESFRCAPRSVGGGAVVNCAATGSEATEATRYSVSYINGHLLQAPPQSVQVSAGAASRLVLKTQRVSRDTTVTVILRRESDGAEVARDSFTIRRQ